MTWTAPDITRGDTPWLGDERTMLDGWLDYHRQTLLLKCSGLTAAQLKQRSVEPSSLALLGIVRHMTELERWFGSFGADLDDLYTSDENPTGDFDDVDGADAEADLARLVAEMELTRKAVADHPLDEAFPDPDEEMILRSVYVHILEEYARHNGHADLLRERIDGATGD